MIEQFRKEYPTYEDLEPYIKNENDRL